MMQRGKELDGSSSTNLLSVMTRKTSCYTGTVLGVGDLNLY